MEIHALNFIYQTCYTLFRSHPHMCMIEYKCKMYKINCRERHKIFALKCISCEVIDFSLFSNVNCRRCTPQKPFFLLCFFTSFQIIYNGGAHLRALLCCSAFFLLFFTRNHFMICFCAACYRQCCRRHSPPSAVFCKKKIFLVFITVLGVF